MKVGDLIESPKLIIHGPGIFQCPTCGRVWEKEGRGIGFVKSGATTHVFVCWEKSLNDKGFFLSLKKHGEFYNKYKIVSEDQGELEVENAKRKFSSKYL